MSKLQQLRRLDLFIAAAAAASVGVLLPAEVERAAPGSLRVGFWVQQVHEVQR